MTLTHIGQQIGDALRQALALGFNNLVQRIGVQRQEVAGGHRSHPLLDSKTQAVASLFIALNCVCHAHQHATANKKICRSHSSYRVCSPFGSIEALVFAQ